MSTALPLTAPLADGRTEHVDGRATRLRGIMIDVPDVFYDATTWRRWLFQLLGRLGNTSTYSEFDRAWEAQLVDVHRGRREFSEALQSFLLAYRLSWAQIDEIEAASRIKRQKLELDVRPLLGAARVAAALDRRDIPLVAWADVPFSAAKLCERLERLVPHARFAAVFSSFEIEAVQPAAECYLAAVQQPGCEPDQVLYVGHNTNHLTGATLAGLMTAAVNHAADARADYLLPRLEELVAVVDRLRGAAVAPPQNAAAGLRSPPSH